MKCIICRNDTIKKNIEYKEFEVSFGNFKAEVCSKCGEIYFEEKIAGKIQEKSKQLGLFGLAKKTKIAEIGNSIAVRIPKNIAIFLGLKKGKEVLLLPKSKHDLQIQV